MKKPTIFLLLPVLVIVLFSACKKGVVDSNFNQTTLTGNEEVDALIKANIANDFNYETTKQTTIDVAILAPDNTPIKNIPVRILNKAEEDGGTVLFKGLTNSQGKLVGNFKLASYYTQVVVDPRYIGVMRNAVVRIVNNTISGTIGGSNGYSGNVVADVVLGGRPQNTGNQQRPTAATISYLGTYNNQGKPDYLLPTNDVISASFLADINASLPERMPVPTYHPDYLSNTAETNLNIVETSDVWYTFVTEGAGYKNSIGFYTYPTNTPPTSVNDIAEIKIILPNASLNGSGGQLVAGNKVLLGRFEPGTTIGFVLVANGWNGTGVGNGYHRVYSNDLLNAGVTLADKRQTVLLYDNSQKLFLVGFEDIKRTDGGCDHDFNDCVFYLTSNPVTGISKNRVNLLDKPVDSDGDGVNNTYDDFPNDPKKAYINYYPSLEQFGTHTFEDNWPYMGDYDVNDLVVNYRYAVISNGVNMPVEMNAKYVLRASGATFKNGFGVQLPFASNLVQSTTGSIVNTTKVVTLAANGVEAGQSKAVIIPFDDAFKAMNTSANFINTYPGTPFISRDTISMDIVFTRPLSKAELGTAPFNPFIIIDKIRGREAHMPGYAPTDKVDSRYFKTGVDNTVPSLGKYYKTTNNLPWGIDFSETFNYPVEGKAINTVYTNFISWAQSNNTIYTNWYKDYANTVTSKVYRR
jgi:LruC domain-containing protein